MVGENWLGNEDAERFPCDVCLEWSREFNDLARREVTRLRLPDLMPYGLAGSNANIASARFYATARRTISVMDYRRDSLATFGHEIGGKLWTFCGRMVRGKDFREWSVWVNSTSEWLANELAMRSKKAWTLYALHTWITPHHRLREYGLGHRWKRSELVPLLAAKNAGVRLIVLELMTQAENK